VVIGSAGSTSSLTVNGDSTLNGGATVSGATALKGDTVIGTSSASATFTVNGASTFSGSTTVGASGTPGSLTVYGASNLKNNTTIGVSGVQSTLIVYGSIAMPTKTLSYDSSTGFTFNDKCTATAFYENSDAKLKGNVVPLTDEAKSKASGIKFVEFDWLSGGGHSYGVIAQDVEKVMPELVLESSSKRVNYIALLCAKVAALEDEISQLKSIINGDDKNIG
jgi:hypothetical protein